jgi:hypothetical protein
VETSWEHLDALLQRRAALALEIAHDQETDPATGYLLTQAAYNARAAKLVDRSESETALSQTLKLLLIENGHSDIAISELSAQEIQAVGGSELIRELRELTISIQRAITVHLEAVASAKRLRAKLLVRIFHLAGHAPAPVRYAFEDEAVF